MDRPDVTYQYNFGGRRGTLNGNGSAKAAGFVARRARARYLSAALTAREASP